MKKFYLSIIIPCFNEERGLPIVVKKILDQSKKLQINSEIIIVNDGSTDNTKIEALKLQKKHSNIKLINHKKNMGFGTSFYSGYKNSSGIFTTHFPGDNEANVEDSLLHMKDISNVDMVVPYVYNTDVRSLSRRFISLLFTKIINLSFSTSFTYTNSCVVYRTSVLKKINLMCTGFLFQTELVLTFKKFGYMYSEVPVLLSSREGGDSKALKLGSILRLLSEFARLFIKINSIKAKKISADSNTHKRLNKS